MEAAKIAEPLLESLRRALDDPDLEYDIKPKRISGGNENDIFSFRLRGAAEPFDRKVIARVFRAEATAKRARKEAAVHKAVAEQGLAAPRVLLVGDELHGVGRSFLIMEHAPGQSTLALVRPSLLLRLPVIHAETMIALHRLDADLFFAAAEDVGLDRRSVMLDLDQETRERRAARDLPSLEKVGVWLDQNRPTNHRPTAITHGDLHPFNLMIDRGRVSAILDWTRALVAPREYDLAANRIIVSFGPVVGTGFVRALLHFYRRWFLHRFESIYRAELPIDEPLVRYFEVQMAFNILTNVALLRRAKASADATLPERDKESGALDGPYLPGMVARVEKLSGVRVELPPRVDSDRARS